MLVLSNEDVERLLSIEDYVAIIEAAYRELGEGRAASRWRSDTIGPAPQPDAVYALKTVDGLLPSARVAAVRINSDVIHWPVDAGFTRREKLPTAPGETWVGLLLLFGTETGEALAVMPDGLLQRLRTGATSALGVKLLAREDADSLALLGSGWQAGAHLMAANAVRPLKRVAVHSPNREHRERFAAEMSEALGLPVEAVDTPQQAVAQAKIVLAATNSLEAVFRAEWLEPGMHLSCIRDSELEVAAVARCDRVAVNNPQREPEHYLVPSLEGRVPEVGNSLRWWKEWRGLGKDEPPLLAELIVGKAEGRTDPRQTTCFLNNLGMGLQFAALGGVVYQRARERGLGHDLPREWFVQTVKP